MTKKTKDLSSKPGKGAWEHLHRISKENYRLPGAESSYHGNAYVLNADDMKEHHPTAEDIKRAKKSAKEAMQKLRKKR